MAPDIKGPGTASCLSALPKPACSIPVELGQVITQGHDCGRNGVHASAPGSITALACIIMRTCCDFDMVNFGKNSQFQFGADGHQNFCACSGLFRHQARSPWRNCACGHLDDFPLQSLSTVPLCSSVIVEAYGELHLHALLPVQSGQPICCLLTQPKILFVTQHQSRVQCNLRGIPSLDLRGCRDDIAYLKGIIR